MRALTFDDYCFIGMIPEELKVDMKPHVNRYLDDGCNLKKAVKKALTEYTNTAEMVERIENYVL